jgi:hypothetical protein
MDCAVVRGHREAPRGGIPYQPLAPRPVAPGPLRTDSGPSRVPVGEPTPVKYPPPGPRQAQQRDPQRHGGNDRSDSLVGQHLTVVQRRTGRRARRVHPQPDLTRTAVLERMSGPLCQAVTESDVTLADLARSNLLLVPLDRRGEWYRYHHLFRDMLLAQLERLEPGLMPVLRRRAAGWFVRNDQPEAALEYSIAAGDVETAAGLVQKLYVPTDRQGRITTIQRWFRWLEDRGGIEGHPMLAVQAAFLSGTMGPPDEAERWADVADRWQYGDPARPGDPSAEAWAALLRAFLCRHGPEQMRADAEEAVQRFAAQSFVTPAPRSCKGSRASFAVTSMRATRPWRMRSASAKKSAHTRMSRSRCANGRWRRWHAANGTGPRRTRNEHAPCCAGPGSRKATPHPWLARYRPVRPCTGETSRRRAKRSLPLSGCGIC